MADDQTLVRDGFRLLVDCAPDLAPHFLFNHRTSRGALEESVNL
jgi:hypothetical protein